jgi:hypothetical protein
MEPLSKNLYCGPPRGALTQDPFPRKDFQKDAHGAQVSWLAGQPTLFRLPSHKASGYAKISSPLTVAGQLPILRDSLKNALLDDTITVFKEASQAFFDFKKIRRWFSLKG